MVGERTSDDAEFFLRDLAGRTADRIQPSTDGHNMYAATVGQAFGQNVDWAQIQKQYAGDPAQGGKYSPAVCIVTKRIRARQIPIPT